MKTEYKKIFSRHLGREMEYKVYGHAGKPVLCIPCQSGRFYEFEDMHMLDVYAPYIDGGKIRVFTIDSLDGETLAAQGDPRARIERHESWIKFIAEEGIKEFSRGICSAGEEVKFGVTGISLGALHAATLFFRFPDIFDSVMCLSGVYTNEYHFGDYHDDLTYINSPQQFIKNMPPDHPYIEKYRSGKMIFCVGQGAWENETLQSTRYFEQVLAQKGINAFFDFWGADVKHDWDWWFVQAAYFLPRFLEA